MLKLWQYGVMKQEKNEKMVQNERNDTILLLRNGDFAENAL
jgi:hypothetical protein